MKRITADKIKKEHLQQHFMVTGYIESIRDHGELVFADLTNNGIILQIVFDPQVCDIEGIKQLRAHSTIKVNGHLRVRSEERVNKRLETGEWEFVAESYKIISKANPLPIDETTMNELRQLEFRNVYLRKKDMQKNIKVKARAISAMRSYLDSQEFYDIETPVLTRTTPGGAKDFLVLSSVCPQNVYGMVQSPQMFKQLLMTTGLERYYQLAKCFRDETLRSDRQPEFLQLDLEISWADMPEIMAIVEGMVRSVGKETGIFELPEVIHMTYEDAMEKYGSDKPDLRFGLELKNVTELLSNTGFESFRKVIKDGGVIKTITIPASHYSRAERKEIEELAKANGAKGLGYFIITEEGINSPLLKFFTDEEVKSVIRSCSLDRYETNQIIYFVADESDTVNKVLNILRLKFGKDLKLIGGTHKFAWITDFPLFEKKEDGKIGSAHHPFTAPLDSDYEEFKAGKRDIMKIRAKAYDLVLNGSEIGGGSVRIHSSEMQSEIFELLKLNETDLRSMQWFVDLFKFGVPEHAGFALGVDRFVMEILGLSSIRETIAFPKNSGGYCQMTAAPSTISQTLWKEYGLKTMEKK